MMDQKFKEKCQKLKLCVFDFDGVFTTNQVLVSQDGVEHVLCNRSDGIGLRLLRAEGLRLIILSTEVNPVVSARAKKLKIDAITGCDDKGSALRQLMSDMNITAEQVSFLGNDINDLECLEMVGLSVAVADSYPEVKSVADWILENAGGHGAIREFCEILFKTRRDIPKDQSAWTHQDVMATYRKVSSANATPNGSLSESQRRGL